jgi:putative hydrolase of the HAD superfamily
MASSPPPRAILFDLDSALISRGLSLERFAERFAAHFGERLGGVTARGVAYGLSEVDGGGFRSHAELAAELRELFPWRERPSMVELTAYWDEVFPQCVALDPEAPPTLRWLRERGMALGVVTSGAAETQRAKIAALGLGDELALTLIAEESALDKANARLYTRAAELLGMPAGAVWMVGALAADCLAARDARLGAIFLRRVYYWPDDVEPPKYEITRLGELVSLLGGETD